MSEPQTQHQARRDVRRGSWSVRVMNASAIVIVAAIAVVTLPSWVSTQQSQAAPVVEASTSNPKVPGNAVRTPVPTATPTPTPTATPTPTTPPPAWSDWSFAGATLSIPKAGINQASVTEMQPNELIRKHFYDNSGNLVEYEAVEPATKEAIVWDTQVIDGVRYPVGSVLSAGAANTSYMYCHDYADGSAPCSIVFDVLGAGDTATIETPTEVLTYTFQESFSLRKGEVPNNTQLNAVVPGRLVIITCNSGGQRNNAGETMENSVIILQLTASVMK